MSANDKNAPITGFVIIFFFSIFEQYEKCVL